MKAALIRSSFLDFFKNKQHRIVPSAPMVIKNDPTLMFTNAGMNQFKDIFLGNTPAVHKRIANTQKCLRVSGKHNDLEEVGHDTYHHTMFEMLGNWSFGDYFKKETIGWAWELLTEVFKIEKDRLYVTVFGGDEGDGLPPDTEALEYWKALIAEDRILFGSKKDNFWEMGDTGPCGPCSEIHVDIRDESERRKTDGKTLVNAGHPLVIEIWNLVFIEYNRLSDGKLNPLPDKHIDTGMGFERLCMVMQGKKSNYDTDIFQPLIGRISEIAGITYGADQKADVAMRVSADHLRAICFAIADGQLPSNNKAGYVIRRILRRAVRYGYTFLGFKTPFLHHLVDVLAGQMGEAFPEIRAQKELIEKVIHEEEQAFVRTLATGIAKFDSYLAAHGAKKVIDGKFAFELFDTYGFPIDLTQLMASEKGWTTDMEGFSACMEAQKDRSRQAAAVETDDWVELKSLKDTEFVGYETLECETHITKYRKLKTRNRELYQIVLEKTPFYAEAGGQSGDRGVLEIKGEKIVIEDTKKENNLIIHVAGTLPKDTTATVKALVDAEKRQLTAVNHTATHLLHAALRQVLGSHVEQKGSFVSDEKMRFDFSHFSALSEDEIQKVEKLVFEKITGGIAVSVKAGISAEKARQEGAIALFGEKYGETVRVVSIGEDFSKELCGGTHIENTGRIGLFVITEETAIAAGVRRIEAITAAKALTYLNENFRQPAEKIRLMLKRDYPELPEALELLIEQNNHLKKQVEMLEREKAIAEAGTLSAKAQSVNGMQFIAEKVDMNAALAKDLAYALRDAVDDLFLVLAFENEGKPGLCVMLSDQLVTGRGMNASAIVRDLAKEIGGGGGGQNYFATAGGKKADGIPQVLKKAYEIASGQPK